MLALDYVHLLSPRAQTAFYLDKAAYYQKLAENAHSSSVRETLEAVARDFANRAKAAEA
jgi:hypothetical protein